MRSELQGYLTLLRLKTKFDLYVYLKPNLFIFLFSLLEDNLVPPALIICKYVWLMYLESCLGPVNNIMLIIMIIREALKHIAYILSVNLYIVTSCQIFCLISEKASL